MQEVPVKLGCVVVDVTRPDDHLRISGEALISSELVEGENIEAPLLSSGWSVAIQSAPQRDLACVRVDREGAVLNKLTTQFVAQVRIPIDVWIDRFHL